MAKAPFSDLLTYLRKVCAVDAARDLSDAELLSRFKVEHDETAFSVLVHRHGPMVLGVCRRVLGSGANTEDAFQATFMVLVRRAGSIYCFNSSLSSWLYGVAQRVAIKARKQEATRRLRERQRETMLTAEPLDDLTWQELLGVLDEEMARLADKFRAPLVLCYLQGKSYEQAARELGWPKGTLTKRIGRARELLRQQLVRRGVTLSAGALATVLCEKLTGPAVGATLTINTVKAAVSLAAGKAAAVTYASAHVKALADGAMTGVGCVNAKVVLMAMAIGLAVGGLGVAKYGGMVWNQEPIKTADAPQEPAADKSNANPGVPARPSLNATQVLGRGQTRLTGEKVTGVVYAADGSPASGAIVWAAKYSPTVLVRQETVADAQGQYALELEPGNWFFFARRGTQGGNGPEPKNSIEIVAGRAVAPAKIRLEDRGTFRGRLLEAETGKAVSAGQLFLDEGLVLTTDADGRFQIGGLSRKNHEAFVVGAGRRRMRVLFDTTGRPDTELEILLPQGGKVVGRVTDLDGKPIPGAGVGRYTSGSYFSSNGLFVACDAEGRFEYDGVSLLYAPELTASVPGFFEEERSALHVPEIGKPSELQFKLRPKPGSRAGATAPEGEKWRVISGVIRGPDKKALEGVLVRWGYMSNTSDIETRTDRRGEFRLTVPDQPEVLAVLPHDFKPAFPHIIDVGDQTVNVVLQEGSTVRGRVVDDDGKPVEGAHLIPTISPPRNIGMPGGYALWEAGIYTDKDGKFVLKGIPKDSRFLCFKSGLHELREVKLDFARDDNVLTMTYATAIVGRAVDQEGKPLRNF
jgi:RNA polymerase sigma factor (sigma-70 family)